MELLEHTYFNNKLTAPWTHGLLNIFLFCINEYRGLSPPKLQNLRYQIGKNLCINQESCMLKLDLQNIQEKKV